MGSQAIDLSNLGAVKATPPPAAPPAAAAAQPGGAIDLSRFGAVSHAQPSTPAPATPGPIDFTANPNSEGTYLMSGPQGKVQVPYSKVEGARAAGFHPDVHDETRYMNDYVADPNGKLAHKALYRALLDPNMQAVEGVGAEGMRTVGGLLNILANGREQALEDQRNYQAKHNPALASQGTQTEDPVVRHTRAAAEFMNRNSETDGFWQHLGGFGENILELMGPEALGALGKGAEAAKGAEAGTALAKGAQKGTELAKTSTELGKSMGAAEKYAQAAKVSQVLEKYPRIKSLVTMGLAAAAKASAEMGVQTYVKTGGDAGAATHAAELGAATGAIPVAAAGAKAGVEGLMPEIRNVEGVEVPVPRETAAKPTPAQVSGAEAYGRTAQGAAVPHLAAVGAPQEFIDRALSTMHDFTGASQRLSDMNEQLYTTLDQATGGEFRQLNREVQKAQKDSFFGGPEAKAVYENKLAQMNDLLQKGTNGQVPPERLQAIKQSWRASYMLSDFGNVLDRSLDGLPGESTVSMEQRGINGRKLQSGIDTLVRRYGVDTVRQTLGPGRLENLQAIAAATKTNVGRANFNRGISEVVHYLGAGLGAVVGEKLSGGNWMMGAAGAAVGAGAARAGLRGTEAVMNAVRTNPNIGRNLLFAIDSGARPERYGPMIGAMVQQAYTERDRQRRVEDEQTRGEAGQQ